MAKTELDMDRLPRHVAIIMDGNGRWATRRGIPHEAGHEAGAKSVRAVIEGCRELGIEVLTLYAFSTENWRRSKHEVNALFGLLSKYVALELENIHKEGIRVTIMGRKDGLPEIVRRDLERCETLTRSNKSMIANVALNYGGRAEIVDAARAIAAEVQAGALDIAAVTEEVFAQHLYVPDLPEPDLLIRTSGELRLSNFMLWELSYAEIVVTKTLWPDFRKRHLHRAIAEYQSRQRRFGGR
ncbi:MAG TPA: isoprenyl transferase [Candidatus Hydrogenedentes bacterium]|nr:isoprenyl transferase [Candidatus Hydrogenedentota bacterium]